MSGVNTNKKIERLDHLIKIDDIALKSLAEEIKKLVKQLKGADKIKYPGIYNSNLKKYNKLMKQYKEKENSKFEKEKIRHEIYEVVFNITNTTPLKLEKPKKKLSSGTIKKRENAISKAAKGLFSQGLNVKKTYKVGNVFGKQKGKGLKKSNKKTRMKKKNTRKN